MLPYTWCVFKNLIVTLIYFAILGKAESPFQTIVISGLALVYMNVGASFLLLTWSGIERDIREFTRFLRLAKLLEDPEIASYEETFEEELNKINSAKVKFYIGLAFATIIFIVAVYKILNVVL